MEAITSKLIEMFCRIHLLTTIYNLNQHIFVTTCMSTTNHSKSHKNVAFNLRKYIDQSYSLES